MYWVLHEIEDHAALWANLRGQLGSDGAVLVAEPNMHVGRRRFDAELDVAREAGFEVCDTPGACISHTAVARHPGVPGAPPE